MLKSQIITELEIAKNELHEWKEVNLDRRKTLSKMLGKYQDSAFSSGGREILDWSEIYFELGKLVQKANDDRSQIDLSNDVKFLLKQEHERLEKNRKHRRGKLI